MNNTIITKIVSRLSQGRKTFMDMSYRSIYLLIQMQKLSQIIQKKP